MANKIIDFELALRGSAEGYSAEIEIDRGADSISHAGPFRTVIDLERLAEGGLFAPDGYGKALSEMVFAEAGMREALAAARAFAGAQNSPLRMRLTLGAGAKGLHSLHWELLTLPGRGERISTREDILFSRYLPAGAAAPQPASLQSLRVLAAIANPSNAADYVLAPLNMEHEKARAEVGMAGMHIDWLNAAAGEPCTLDRLAERVPGHDVLYLVCHGKWVKDQSWLFLECENGTLAPASAQKLAERLAGTLALPRLAVLIVCESAGSVSTNASAGAQGEFLSALAPRLVETGIPAVIAMQGNLSFQTSNLFLPALFRELRKDGRIDRAVAVARRSIMGRPDEHAPVLFMSLKSGLLWETASAASAPAASAPAASATAASATAAVSRPAPAADSVRLYQALSGEAFSLEDLESLCFNLGVDWEQLRGSVKPAKARAMVQYFQSRGRIQELVAAVRTERPHLDL
jgi:hypothetical protein